MASGDVVGIILEIVPPGATFAAFGVRAGGSTPAEQEPIWNFDAATIEYLDFWVMLRGYAGGGLTIDVPWMGATATTGVTRWGLGIRRRDTADDIDVAHTYDYNDVDATVPGTSGFPLYTPVTFTNGADMDSWANGEVAVVRLRRNASHANDTMAGDAQLIGGIVIRET